jgi:hypothetical protein
MYFFGAEAAKIKGIPWAQNNNGNFSALRVTIPASRIHSIKIFFLRPFFDYSIIFSFRV